MRSWHSKVLIHEKNILKLVSSSAFKLSRPHSFSDPEVSDLNLNMVHYHLFLTATFLSKMGEKQNLTILVNYIEPFVDGSIHIGIAKCLRKSLVPNYRSTELAPKTGFTNSTNQECVKYFSIPCTWAFFVKVNSRLRMKNHVIFIEEESHLFFRELLKKCSSTNLYKHPFLNLNTLTVAVLAFYNVW